MAPKPPNSEEEPQDYHYSFFDDFEDAEGIFANRADPYGSYGDPAAVEDMEAERITAPMMMLTQLDGIPAPVPDFDAMKVLDAPSRVSDEEMVCLAGPCKYYIENIVQTGTLPDGKPFLTMKRYCTRLKTWAELMTLDDVDVLSCSGHEARGPVTAKVADRINKNAGSINFLNSKAMNTEGHDLGVCFRGSCHHYIVLIIRTLDVEGNFVIDKKRFCAALAGAARPRLLLSYQPVLGCTALKCTLPDGPQRWRALSRNQDAIDAHRRRDEARRGSSKRSDRDDTARHNSSTGEHTDVEPEGVDSACPGDDVPTARSGSEV